MARPKKMLTDEDIEKLQSITRGDNTAAVGYRLAAVRAYTVHSAEEVASFFDTEPETVIRWASKFHLRGVQGLENKARGHRRMKLTKEMQEAIREWLNNDVDRTGQPVHWTLKRLCLEVKSVFSVDISIAAMGSTLKKMGMAQKRPRPMHYKSSSEAREEFKKKSAKHACRGNPGRKQKES